MIREPQKAAAALGIAAAGITEAVEEVRRFRPWARSVVSAAVCYLPPHEQAPEDDIPRGLVARFARGVDYHAVLRNKLCALANTILLEYPEARVEICVDTVPIPERRLAVLAGIARPCKNANVYVEGCGTYAALGELVTDALLPAANCDVDCPCGECDACLRACPTGAIVEPFRVDPSKCLSAATQSPGVLPDNIRRALGNRIYGCDVCQEVCPLNADAGAVVSEFAQRVFPGAFPELIPLIELSAQDFRDRVKNSSIGWIGRTRIRRNAALAAGNLGRHESVPALETMLLDANPVLRDAAGWALNRIGGHI